MARGRDRKATTSRGPVVLGDLIGAFVAQHRLEKRVDSAIVREAWPEAVGAQIANKAVAGEYENGTLVVRVANSSWRQELQFLQKELIGRVNSYLAAQASDLRVKELKFQIGETPSGVARAPKPR